jgi:hypothetical protein
VRLAGRHSSATRKQWTCWYEKLAHRPRWKYDPLSVSIKAALLRSTAVYLELVRDQTAVSFSFGPLENLFMATNSKNISPTIRHILGQSQVKWVPKRLQFDVTKEKIPTDYRNIADQIRCNLDDHVFVPDTCFFTAHDIPDTFWDSILTKKIAITSSIFEELKPWMQNPKYNRQMVPYVTKSQDSDSSPVVAGDAPEAWGRYWTMAMHYYATLLSSRKDMAFDLIAESEARKGRRLTTDEIRRLLQRNYLDRDLKMVLKAVEKGRDANWWTDEKLVTVALQIGILTGQSTSILTRDRDVLEQFERLCVLVNIDYQAYRFGLEFEANRDRFKCIPMPNDALSEEYMVTSESLLVRKPVQPDDFVEWVLPSSFHPVTVSCILFGGPPNEMTVQVISYSGEQEIGGLMRTKGKTLGRSVELPGDLNCHVTGFWNSIPTPRQFVIVGRDRLRSAPPGTTLQWARLDYEHSVTNFGLYNQQPRSLD